jgi:integrase/recombinase XerD
VRPSHERALAAFEEDLLRRNRAPATWDDYLRLARRFLERTPKPIARLTRDDVRRFLAGRADEVGPVTQEGDAYRLRSFFKALVEAGLLAKSPADGFRVKRAHRPDKPALSEGQVRAMLAAALDEPGRGGYWSRACRLRDRACLELLYGLGLRRSEACAARIPDLSLADATLLVRPAKLGKPRTLPLPPSAIPALLRYLTDARPVLAERGSELTDHLLLAKNGRSLDHQNVNLLARRVGKRAGIPGAHPHMLRRSLATHLVRAGVSERVVQLLLGHAKLTTTATYLAVDREELRRTVELLERNRARGC